MARSTVLISGAATLSILAYGTTALAVDCFVDSVGGSDTNNGTSDTTPVQSIAKLASNCTTVKFKRGSVFNIPVGSYIIDQSKLGSGRIMTLTNYGDISQPLPQFIKPHQVSSGGMIQTPGGTASAGFTIDGIYMSGSRSDAAMSNLAQGICVMLGAYSTIINSEITLCDIGMMTYGDHVTVKNNYVHDLSITVDAAPGVDPNAVGGAEGIFVNTSHVEVAYNKFVRCSTLAQWVSGTNPACDGGATEVTVPYAGTVTDVNIHHNLSYYSCGFFEVSSMFNTGSGAYVKGQFTNSVFHDNLMIDSGWISLLQVNNTKLSNVRWENNTIVHHKLGSDSNGTNLDTFISSGIQAIAFNSTSSGVTGGGVIDKGDIYWTNNLWYFASAPYSTIDATHTSSDALLANIVVTGDKVFTTDPGFKNISAFTNINAAQLDDPSSYDLVKGSAAIDQGVSNSNITADVTTDFLNRSRPVGAAFDLGAFEYPGDSATGGTSGTGGTSTKATGGAPGTGGSSTKATGGVPAAGGSGTQASGGSPTVGTGGSPTSVTGGAPTLVTGGSPNAGGATASNSGGRLSTGGGVSAGGTTSTGGSPASGVGGTSSTSAATNATGGAGTATTTGGAVSDSGSCSCKVPGKSSRSGTASWVALLMLSWGLGRRAKRSLKHR